MYKTNQLGQFTTIKGVLSGRQFTTVDKIQYRRRLSWKMVQFNREVMGVPLLKRVFFSNFLFTTSFLFLSRKIVHSCCKLPIFHWMIKIINTDLYEKNCIGYEKSINVLRKFLQNTLLCLERLIRNMREIIVWFLYTILFSII